MNSNNDIKEILSLHNVTVVKEMIWTDKVHLALLDSNVLIFTALKPFEFDLELLKEFHQNNAAFVENKPVRFLFQMSAHYIQIPPDVLKYILNTPGIVNLRIAEAIVVNSLPNRLLVNFYIRLSRNKVPTLLFNETKKAYAWLLQKELRSEQLEKSV